MKLSKRLLCIAEMIEKCSTIADVGTDHAFLPIYLLQNGKCNGAIASDIRNGPAQRAENNIKKSNLEDHIQVRIGSGLSVLSPGEAQTIIIAGMGGLLISEILSEGHTVAENAENIVLQPMTHHFELRQWLYENGYQIIDEELVKEEEKIYIIFKIVHHGKNESCDNYFGTILFNKKHPLLKEYISKNINELEKVRQGLVTKKTFNSEKRLQEINLKLEQFKESLSRT